MLQFLKNLVADDSGQDLIEYALVAALIGITAVSALRLLSNTIGNAFNNIGNTIASAGT